MLKKSLIFGTVALFLTALIAFTGCTQATDSDTTSSGGGRNSVWGRVTPSELQKVIDLAILANEPVYLEDDLEIAATTPGSAWVNTVNFKTATVKINGKVQVLTTGAPVHFNAARATVSGSGSLSTNNGDYIARNKQPGSQLINGGNTEHLVQFGSLTDTQWQSTKIAVADFKYGPLSDHDYSTGDAVVPNSKITRIYVLDTVTLPASTSIGAPGVEVIAFGDVDVIGATETGLISQAAPTTGKFLLGSSSTLTSSTGNVVVTIPNDGKIPNVKVAEITKPITLTGASTGLTLDSVSGPGFLAIKDGLTGPVAISGGAGNITFLGDVALTTNDLTVSSTGTTIFEGEASAKNVVIAGDVVFKTGVEVAEDLTLLGNTTLYNQTDTNDNVFAIALADESVLTLAKDKTISVGGNRYTGTNANFSDPVTVLTAVADTTILALDNGGFVAPFAVTEAQSANVNNSPRLYLTAPIAIKSGTLRVDTLLGIAPDVGILTTDISATDRKDRIDGNLALADGAVLHLISTAGTVPAAQITAGSSSAGAIGLSSEDYNTIIVPINTISGPDTGNPTILTATGGVITLNGEGLKSAESASLTVTGVAGSLSVGGNLGLSGVTLDIKAGTPLSLTAEGNTVQLTNRAGLIVNTAEGAPSDYRYIQSGSDIASVTGGVEVKGSGKALVSVSQNGSTDAVVIRSLTSSLSLGRNGTTLVLAP
jgi:hypothetical protein